MKDQVLSYVVGEETRLADILADAEVMPLLRGALRAGAREVSISDDSGALLWGLPEHTTPHPGAFTFPLYLEGETVGYLAVSGAEENDDKVRGVATLLLDAVNSMATNNLKRMLTTRMHTQVVNQSYEELVQTNRQLAVSEERYRQLAGQLEIKVEERTSELKKVHARLLQQEKMASVGQLAAGMAHEINNPLGFIISNLHTFGKYTERFVTMLQYHRSLLRESVNAAAADAKWRELRLDTICDDVGDLLKQSLDGAERVKRLVADLKGFSHIDDGTESVVDINSEIESTLTILSHTHRKECEIVRDLHPLPGFPCNPALLCQVFASIIQNAFQCREEGVRLAIATAHDGTNIRITFTDNGPGIPDEIRGRVFEPFFTTKAVGSGTGMGLTVAYDIITGYGGTIEVESETGSGARFIVTLPAPRTYHGEVL